MQQKAQGHRNAVNGREGGREAATASLKARSHRVCGREGGGGWVGGCSADAMQGQTDNWFWDMETTGYRWKGDRVPAADAVVQLNSTIHAMAQRGLVINKKCIMNGSEIINRLHIITTCCHFPNKLFSSKLTSAEPPPRPLPLTELHLYFIFGCY